MPSKRIKDVSIVGFWVGVFLNYAVSAGSVFFSGLAGFTALAINFFDQESKLDTFWFFFGGSFFGFILSVTLIRIFIRLQCQVCGKKEVRVFVSLAKCHNCVEVEKDVIL